MIGGGGKRKKMKTETKVKRKFSRFLAIALSFAMVFGLLPGLPMKSFAAPEEYDVWVQGIRVTDANKDDVLGDGGSVKYTWISDLTGELTLKNAHISGGRIPEYPGNNNSKHGIFGIYARKNIDLVLKGNNTIKTGNNGEYCSWGICTGSLTIKGSGRLNVETGKSGNTTAISCRDFVMQNGTVIAKTGENTHSPSYALDTNKAWIENGDFTAISKDGYGNMAIFLRIHDKLQLNGGTLTAIGSKRAIGATEIVMSNEIEKYGRVIVNRAPSAEYSAPWDKVTPLNNSYDPYKYVKISSKKFDEYDVWVGGIRVTSENMLNVLGKTDKPVQFVPATETTPAKLILNNAKIYGTTTPEGKPFNHTAGIYSEIDLDIELNGNSEIFGCAAQKMSTCIYVNKGSLGISGAGNLELNASGAFRYSYGIIAENVKMYGGTVIVKTGKGGRESRCVEAEKSFTMFGGTKFIADAAAVEKGVGVSTHKLRIYGGEFTAIDQLLAINCSKDNLMQTDRYVHINYAASEEGAISWDGDGFSMVKYLKTGPATYSVNLSQTGQHEFKPGIATVYKNRTPLEVEVSNTGTGNTGPLQAELSGTGKDKFQLEFHNVLFSDLKKGEKARFTVAPKNGLDPGVYEATVTLSGAKVESRSFSVKFVVNHLYGISLDRKGIYKFTPAVAGYGGQEPVTVKVANTGTGDTGELDVKLLGVNANKFTLSKTKLDNIQRGESAEFTVVPKTGLTPGTYTAEVAVSSDNPDIATKAFKVSFVVKEAPPTYGISLNWSDTYEFYPAIVGYSPIQGIEVRVRNTGTGGTGDLKVKVEGTNGTPDSSFTVSENNISGIAAGEYASFMVAPAIGLDLGKYTAKIKVVGAGSNPHNFSESFNVEFETAGTWEIYFTERGVRDFGYAKVDYSSLTPKVVEVGNGGTAPTGELDVKLSGAGKDAFILSRDKLESIESYKSGSFTVVPKDGLAAGEYNAKVTVSGGHELNESFDVKFRVTAANIELDKSGTIDMGSVVKDNYDYDTLETVTVSNTGTGETGELSVELSGAGKDSLIVNRESIPNIAAGESSVFTVSPKKGIDAGNYNATVTVKGGYGLSEKFDVKFAVVEPTYSVEINPGGTIDFGTFDEGSPSSDISPKTITVKNTGTGKTDVGISLSGGSASKYFISANNLELGPGEAGSFIIEPFSMPEAGTYTETVTLSNGGAVNENFDVSLTVKPKAIPICEVLPLDENDAYIFPPSVVGYAPKTAKEVTVRNWGSANTGKLEITLSGRNAESFELNKSSIPDLGKGGTDTFTVVPKTGLAVGTYRAKVTMSGGPGIESRSFYVSFTVEAAKTYRISLSKSGTYDFGTEIKGTYPQSANVGVTNTGTEETGALTLALSGADAASFELTKESLPSTEVGGFDSFNVNPKYPLPAGTYNATVTVSGANGISESFDVKYTVTELQQYGISLNPSGTHDFGAVVKDYPAQDPHYVLVRNAGTEATGNLAIELSGDDADKFTLGKAEILSMDEHGSDMFTVVPKDDLNAGTYNATVTVSGEHDISESFDVKFTVSDTPIYSIELDKTGTHDFGLGIQGYYDVTPVKVNVRNTGTESTGALTVALSGGHASSFDLSKESIPSIAKSGGDTFTVVPKTGLAAGTYKETVTVSGANGISESFDVKFTVTNTAIYSIKLDKGGTYDFGIETVGYSAVTPEPVVVTNDGTNETGELNIALSGADASSFTLSAANLASIDVGGTGSFTVVPNTGLDVGTYNATVTVSGEHGISESFDVEFTVNPVSSTYSISLSRSGTCNLGTKITGYSTVSPEPVVVTNDGTNETGELNIALSGADASSFTVSAANLASISPAGTGSFTIAPKIGLAQLEIGRASCRERV